MSAKQQLKSWIHEADKIAVLTGAGFSVPSGIPDFRSEGGLYSERGEFSAPPETILSRTFFFSHTSEFYEFYWKKMIYPDAKPNIAHQTLAKLEEMGKDVAIITQNIDGLHQAAGSRKVIEFHGSIHRNYCIQCHTFYSLEDILSKEGVPRCLCGGIIKPDVVLYEEPLNQKDLIRAMKAIEDAELLIVAGTSLNVQPAASLVYYYKGHRFVMINLSETPYDHYANLIFHEPLETILNDELLVE